jgi:hypothetical protein
MISYPNRSEVEWSQINQPTGNIECSIYSACAAVDFVSGGPVDVNAVRRSIGARLGGNTDKTFQQLLGFGLTKGEAYKDLWVRCIALAVSSVWKIPVCFGVGFSQSYSKKHWIYMVGWQGNNVYARDQQNAHRLIEISMATWLGSVSGQPAVFQCKLNQLGLGFASREIAAHFIS